MCYDIIAQALMLTSTQLTGSPKLKPTPIQSNIPDDWEHLYLYGTEVLGTDRVKLCQSAQPPVKFTDRTSRFYPDPIVIHLKGIHPVNKRNDLEKKLDAHACGNGFYTLNATASLAEYLQETSSNTEIKNLETEVINRLNILCEPSNTQTLKISDVIDRLSMVTKTGKPVSNLVISTILSSLVTDGSDSLPYYWKHDSLAVYKSFINYYVNKNRDADSIRFADILIAARKWFVVEERMNGHKIPHKAARRSTLIKLLNERFGESTQQAGHGVKDCTWKICLPIKV